MKFGKTVLQSALVSVFALAANGAFAEGEEMAAEGAKAGETAEVKMEKCYGVAKKGQNDCGTATHGCAGKAAKDFDEKEWKNVKEGTCKDLQAKAKKPAAKAK